MAAQDKTNGWPDHRGVHPTLGTHHGAPAAAFWHCPECDCNSAVEDWGQPSLLGADARSCPNCKHVFANHQAGRISAADSAGLVKWHDGAKEYTRTEWQKAMGRS